MKLKTHRLWMTAAGTTALVLSACSNPPSVAEVQEDAASRSVALLIQANASARTATSGEAMAAIVNGASVVGEADAPTFPEDAEAQAALDRVRAYLRDRIFTEENVEGTDGSALIFRLMGDDVCTDGTAPVDPGCRTFVDAAQVRLRVERSAGEQLTITLMLGERRAAPVAYVVGPKRLALQLALGEIKAAAAALGVDGRALAAELPRVLEGRLQAALEKKGEGHFQFAFSILEPAKIEHTVEQGPVSFRTAVADPLTLLETDAPGRRVRLAADVKATQITLPYRMAAPGGIAGTQLAFDLGGLSFDFEGAEDQVELGFGHLGLGEAQSKVSLDGVTLFSADLNKDRGRSFDLTFDRDGDRVVSATVSPELDLALRFALAPLTGEIEFPEELADETFRFRLFGQGGAKVGFHEADEATGARGAWEMLSGNFLFSVASAGSLEASTGQCITTVDSPDEASHPLLGKLTVTSCE